MRKPIQRTVRIALSAGILFLGLMLTGLASKTYAEDVEQDTQPEFQRLAFLSRPDPDGVPTKVSVGVFIVDVTKIDDVNQTFTADFYFIYFWNDPRLAVKGGADVPEVRSFEFDDIWHPYLVIINQRNLKRYEDDVFRVDRSGNVQYVQRFHGELSSPLDLKDFCFDKQELPFIIVSVRFGPDEVSLSVDEPRTGQREQFSIAGWTVQFDKPQITKEKLAFRELARIDFLLKSQRHTGRYFIKLLIPLSLIVFMAWAVFWIDPSAIGPQIGLPTSAVFTFILFNFRIGQVLPRISYLTRMDRFVLGATFLVFMALGEAILTTMLTLKDKKPLAIRIDHATRYLYIVLFVLLIVVAFLI